MTFTASLTLINSVFPRFYDLPTIAVQDILTARYLSGVQDTGFQVQNKRAIRARNTPYRRYFALEKHLYFCHPVDNRSTLLKEDLKCKNSCNTGTYKAILVLINAVRSSGDVEK